MKVLVIGGGGREHALVWKIKQSEYVKKLYCIPGNGGIAKEAVCEDIPVEDSRSILNYAITNKIDLTVVGPEVPLVNGIVDLFESNGMPIFGPSQRAAEIEGSKVFAKYLLEKYNIPTAAYQMFSEFEQARKYVSSVKLPIVVKANGLAAGKGVVVCNGRETALEALHQIMVEKIYGSAGDKVIIEEFLQGQEISIIGISDAENLVYLVPSQDHKRIFDNDQGPNTGGMGAFAPVPFVDKKLMNKIKKEIMEPAIKGMALEEKPYKGALYAGLIITKQGPKVLEFNCRFGDPEAQVILPLAKSDLVEAMMASRDGLIKNYKWENHINHGVCVVIASGGYPGKYEKDKKILGLQQERDTLVFHAGTKKVENDIVTSGGRVLGVTALADSLPLAIKRTYQAVGKITFDGAYYRKDIGAKGLKF